MANEKKDDSKDEKKAEKPTKSQPPAGKGLKRRKRRGEAAIVKIPQVFPTSKCRLRLLKLERIKDYLLMEEEFIRNQELLKPREEQDETEKAKVDDLRGTPMTVGTLEELIDDNHAIVASSMGPEYYVTIMSFVNQDLLEAGSSVLLHNKVTIV
jgi:26S proteasome regulatory subunit T2